MSSSKPIIFVTGNAGKLRESRAILAAGPHPIELEARNLDVPELQGTTQEVAIAKCRHAAKLVGGPCITEDTCLCFLAFASPTDLPGTSSLPGPYIKHFLTALGHAGLNTLLEGFPTTKAYALCTFAYSPGPTKSVSEATTAEEEIPVYIFEGRTDGKIVPARGPPNFGWDPCFEPDESGGQTYAEMSPEAKNGISHRYRALDKLRAFLQTQS